jgi:integrase
LAHREAVALAGEVYGAMVGSFEDDPGTASLWAGVIATNAKAQAGEFGRAELMIGDEAKQAAAMEERFGRFVDGCLASRALAIDAESRVRLLDQIATALNKAALRLAGNAAGDYSADENIAKAPAWKDASAATPSNRAAVGATITACLAGWWTEAQARNLSLSTYEGYSATIAKLRAFLGHDNAAGVTPDDIIRFKDFRLASVNPRNGKPISAGTVKDSDLAALKTVFGWAEANRKLPANPAKGITMRVAKRRQTRSKGLSETEATALLAASFSYDNKLERPKMVAAKRWVPWLCAYTGGRLGEMVQLRQQDVRLDGNVWTINITPEAGTVKTNEARVVALHPHLLAMGFIAFVQASQPGHLFLTLGKAGDVRGPWRGVKNRLQEFARETVKDPDVAPNHGWRHRFKTVGRSVGIDAPLLDRITGHAPASVGDAYGDYGIDVQFEAISRMPAYPERITDEARMASADTGALPNAALPVPRHGPR